MVRTPSPALASPLGLHSASSPSPGAPLSTPTKNSNSSNMNGAAAAPSSSSQQQPQQQQKCVIVIAREETVISTVKQSCQGSAIEVFNTCMGAMTFLVSGKRDPSLAVVDLTGNERAARIDLLRTLRARYPRSMLRVLVLGDRPEEDLELASELECDDYLSRPVLPRKLQSSVERCLMGH